MNLSEVSNLTAPFKPTETTNKQAKSGENIKHLHHFGIKYFGISGASGAFLSGINGIILCAFSE